MQNSQKILKAEVVGSASKRLVKPTSKGESIFVLHNCRIIEEGTLFGKVVTGQRTLFNSEGIEKSGVSIGDVIYLYVNIVEDPIRGRKPFFNISTALPQTSDKEILEALSL